MAYARRAHVVKHYQPFAPWQDYMLLIILRFTMPAHDCYANFISLMMPALLLLVHTHVDINR